MLVGSVSTSPLVHSLGRGGSRRIFCRHLFPRGRELGVNSAKNRHLAAVSSTTTWPCFFSTNIAFTNDNRDHRSGLDDNNRRRLNEDNMSPHHDSHELPPQEWTTYHGKIPILQEKKSEEEWQ